MAGTLELLSKSREAELRNAAEARELQDEQQRLAALADEYHGEIRRAADALGRKAIATDIGVDLSTVSNWLSCEQGRGFPPPRLLLHLRKHWPPLLAWEADHADHLPPVRKETAIDEREALAEIERQVLPELGKRNADTVREILRRVKKGAR